MGRLSASAKYLYEGERKFYARGVSYGTFAPNSHGEPFPEPERVAADFALMRELGANVVRTYEPPPPWMMEAAAKCGLRVMLGIPWASHLAFLDSAELSREIRATIHRTVAAMRDFRDAIFAYTLGNEIRSDIVRWHGPRAVSRFLAELYDLGKQLDPEGLFTYANYPSTEYLDLSCVDFVSFNVYLHREADLRRYLTHVMALSGELPLILSETGIDTIREGEEQQASFLGWQSRAAFELGLAGLIVFAFTDEWFRGGHDIRDWAFGLVTRERRPKPAFAVVAEAFKGAIPPPLKDAPKASVVVAARNAETTLGDCLESLADLNYPDYETIVVDDGSTDSTAALAEAAGARVLRREHRGLAAARNAGADTARGEIVAFIDADARADRDWLYHLVETVARRDCASGGPNFAPNPDSALAAAIEAAPGPPREVPLGDDTLAQLCGCNMAIRRSTLKHFGGFDTTFTAAGDDVDFSWRLRDSGESLAAAPGAVVIHDRRETVGAYLAQQRGYGAAEGLLWRKYPLRTAAADGVYGGGSWLASLLGGRVYYGAYGRGLFQSVYPAGGAEEFLQISLSVQWLAASVILAIAGALNGRLLALGCGGLAISLGCAAFAAVTARLNRAHRGLPTRLILAALWMLGPALRSFERTRIRWRLPSGDAVTTKASRRLRLQGAVAIPGADGGPPLATKPFLDALRAALVHRGLAVAPSDGFEPYDLQIRVPPALRIAVNTLDEGEKRLAVLWRIDLAWRALSAGFAGLVVLLIVAGASPAIAVLVIALVALALFVLGVHRASRIPAILETAVGEALGAPIHTTTRDGEPVR